MERAKKYLGVLLSIFLLTGLSCEIAGATTIEITNFADFPAYPYNNGSYMDSGAYVGCGPTTGAMVLGYFENKYGFTNLLTDPTPAGVDQGLATAWALHSSTYLNTQPDGFGNIYNVRPGMESYVASRGPEVIGGQTVTYSLDVMIHVGPTYDATHPGSWTGAPDGYNSYGAFGDAWTNDATFYAQNASGWYMDDAAFYTQTSAWLSAGIPVWLTIDQDATYGGDHWVPMVKVDDAGRYYYYDTFSGTLQSANIAYLSEYGYGGTHAISAVRTVSLAAVISGGGGEVPVPEPSTLLIVASGFATWGAMAWRRRRRG